MMMMIMSMRWDYVCELRPPAGLLFIPKNIYEYGDPWWNGIDKGKLLIRLPDLSGNHASSHLVAEQDELAKEVLNLALRSIFVHTSKGRLTCCKILRLEADSFTSLRRKAAADFYLPLPGLKPRTLGPVTSTLTTIPPMTIPVYDCVLVWRRRKYRELLGTQNKIQTRDMPITTLKFEPLVCDAGFGMTLKPLMTLISYRKLMLPALSFNSPNYARRTSGCHNNRPLSQPMKLYI
jgi:hypothetical protein